MICMGAVQEPLHHYIRLDCRPANSRASIARLRGARRPGHPAVTRMLQDHMLIRRDADRVASEPSLELLHDLGRRLAGHVQLEEREVFPLIRNDNPRARAGRARRASTRHGDTSSSNPAVLRTPWSASFGLKVPRTRRWAGSGVGDRADGVQQPPVARRTSKTKPWSAGVSSHPASLRRPAGLTCNCSSSGQPPSWRSSCATAPCWRRRDQEARGHGWRAGGTFGGRHMAQLRISAWHAGRRLFLD